ncbi:uncharacterized protein ASCRUDRAFT_13742 [Ascoidea rubescens DSM 1968]|uniref:Decapping nuclease n=1 Tax=Ascoidea rubescens DSM 1968 TaxID=1344418 RepID=A0A1D2VGH4_9ASCO|nr:hypothetical protein ASCRUDRAFT_13742 [Ascoidea rubescens DSM 1968]ODV60736.1 hypothetical protein ASCRUDRAFT_13742 [Ascoidea rubescens DSM 1968]
MVSRLFNFNTYLSHLSKMKPINIRRTSNKPKIETLNRNDSFQLTYTTSVALENRVEIDCYSKVSQTETLDDKYFNLNYYDPLQNISLRNPLNLNIPYKDFDLLILDRKHSKLSNVLTTLKNYEKTQTRILNKDNNQLEKEFSSLKISNPKIVEGSNDDLIDQVVMSLPGLKIDDNIMTNSNTKNESENKNKNKNENENKNKNKNKNKNFKLQPNIVTTRGCLARLAACGLSDLLDFTFNVCYFDKSIYISNDNYRETEKNLSDWQKKNTVSGYVFEQLLAVKSPESIAKLDSKTKMDIISRQKNPNNSDGFNSLTTFNISYDHNHQTKKNNSISFLLKSEIDCAYESPITQKEKEVPATKNYLELKCISISSYVLQSITGEFTFEKLIKLKSFYRERLLNYYFQCYFSGVDALVVGFRNETKLFKVEKFTLGEIERLMPKHYVPTSLNWFIKVITFLIDNIKKEDFATYKIKLQRGSGDGSHLQLIPSENEEEKEKTRRLVLSDEFVQYRQSLN